MEVRESNKRMVAIVLVFEEEVVVVVCAYATRVGDRTERRINLIMGWHASGIYRNLMK